MKFKVFDKKLYILITLSFLIWLLFLLSDLMSFNLFLYIYRFPLDVCLFLLPPALIFMYLLVFFSLFKKEIIEKYNYLMAVLLFITTSAIMNIHIQNIMNIDPILISSKSLLIFLLFFIYTLNGIVIFTIAYAKKIKIYNIYYWIIPVALFGSLLMYSLRWAN